VTQALQAMAVALSRSPRFAPALRYHPPAGPDEHLLVTRQPLPRTAVGQTAPYITGL